MELKPAPSAWRGAMARETLREIRRATTPATPSGLRASLLGASAKTHPADRHR
jgi:hypothetical protein